MAVTKIWAIHDSVSRVVDYCTNPSKTKLSDLEQVLLYGRHDFLPKIMCSNGRLAKRKAQSYGRKALI